MSGNRGWILGWVLVSTLCALAVWRLGPGAVQGQEVTMVRVEAGPFSLGSDDGPLDERPPQRLDLPTFEIDRLPVTTAQFAEFLSAGGPLSAQGQRRFDHDDPDARIHQMADGRYVPAIGYEQHPVVEASWYGARDFCAWRGARLPTEVEWEKAARGADGRPYPWGWQPPDETLARFGLRNGEYLPVGSLPANASPTGALDLAGNIWHWTSSLYWPYPYRADDGRENPDDPGERVTRGGSHSSRLETLRSAHRGQGLSRAPSSGHHNIGFRCAR
jgi:formylglycine-generating enzyme required for sulfatase activity